MQYKKAPFFAIILSIGITPVFGAQLNLNINPTLSLVSNITQNGNVSDAGIIIDNNAISTVDTHGYSIFSNNNFYGFLAQSGGSVIINGNGQNKISLENNTGFTSFYVKDTDTSVTLNNINIEIQNNVSLSDIYNAINIGDAGYYSPYGEFTFNGNGSNYINISENIGYSYMCGIASSVGATTTIKNSNIMVNNNVSLTDSLFGITSYYYGTLELTGNGRNKIQINNNYADQWAEAISIGETTIANIKGYDIEAKDNAGGLGAYAFVNYGELNITGVSRRNTMILSNNQTAGGYVGGASIMSVKNMNIYNSGSNFVEMYDTGTIDFKNSSVNIQGAYTGIMAHGNTNVNLTNSNMISQNALINVAANPADSLTPVAANITALNSTISGASQIDDSIANTLNFNMTKSRWNMMSSSVVTNMVANNSIIDLRGNTYNTLNINNLTGTGNTFLMRAFFDGNGSNTDKIVIGDDFSGNALLLVSSAGSNGKRTPTGSDGILVVDTSTTTTNTGNVILAGGRADGGVYEYVLRKSDIDNNWYLRSTGNITSAAKSNVALPGVQLGVFKAGMNELNIRLGELRYDQPKERFAPWIRTYAKSIDITNGTDATLAMYGVEAGMDYRIANTQTDRIYFGISGGNIFINSIKTEQNNGFQGNGNGNAPSVGAYLTWINEYGWFIDAVTKYFWSDIHNTNYDSTGNPIELQTNRGYMAFNLEAGRQMQFSSSYNSAWLLEPKLELNYGISDTNDFTTSNGFNVHYDATQNVEAKASLNIAYRTMTAGGTSLQPYLEFSFIDEFDSITNIQYAGIDFESDLKGTSVRFAGGLNAKIASSLSFYSMIAYETGQKLESWYGNIGLRYKF